MAIIKSLRKGVKIKEQYKKFTGRKVIFILALIPVVTLLVGLVAPHICRMIIGGDNRFLLSVILFMT